jgi:multidrug efflux pump subunit AcrA (membrane-fusion protein)
MCQSLVFCSLSGRLLVSKADVTIDSMSPESAKPTQASALTPQLPYYAARIEIPDSELVKLDGGRIVPGMQVDTFIKTDERTVMSYLLKPITDRMAHAMRER